jgi:hypothetical protein
VIPRVNLGESAVHALLNNKAAVAAFPFLKDAPVIRIGGCGGCGGRPRKTPDPNWIKQRIANLGKKDRARIRELLNTKQVVGNYRENGQLKTFVF